VVSRAVKDSTLTRGGRSGVLRCKFGGFAGDSHNQDRLPGDVTGKDRTASRLSNRMPGAERYRIDQPRHIRWIPRSGNRRFVGIPEDSVVREGAVGRTAFRGITEDDEARPPDAEDRSASEVLVKVLLVSKVVLATNLLISVIHVLVPAYL
jgi:hypothetical protein